MADEVDLHKELIRGISYRIHSASHRGRFVAVKAFEGPRAKQVSVYLIFDLNLGDVLKSSRIGR